MLWIPCGGMDLFQHGLPILVRIACDDWNVLEAQVTKGHQANVAGQPSRSNAHVPYFCGYHLES